MHKGKWLKIVKDHGPLIALGNQVEMRVRLSDRLKKNFMSLIGNGLRKLIIGKILLILKLRNLLLLLPSRMCMSTSLFC